MGLPIQPLNSANAAGVSLSSGKYLQVGAADSDAIHGGSWRKPFHLKSIPLKCFKLRVSSFKLFVSDY